MRIVVDTNIVFSAILNTDSRIARILLRPRTRLNFYSSNQLLEEIQRYSGKLQKLSGYTERDLKKVTSLIINKIRFIDIALVPGMIYNRAEVLTSDIDIDDTEFIALTDHLKGKFWSGDKVLISGLHRKKWMRTITTTELYKLIK